MKTESNYCITLFAALATLLLTIIAANAQLVADGATASINGVSTNLAGNLTVGNTGSSTTLIITNAGFVTNSGNGVIGFLTTARTNQVIVTGANSLWANGAFLTVGVNGKANRLVVTNGGSVINTTATIGSGPSAFANVAIVTDVGSRWKAAGPIGVGSVGSTNGLVIANGGQVSTVTAQIAVTADSHDNFVTVMDAGSLLVNTFQFVLGVAGSNNSLVISNGGAVVNTGGSIGSGAGSVNNRVLVTGGNSAWTNRTDLLVGELGAFNQLTVTNAGTVLASNLYIGFGASSSNNLLNLSGGNLIVTNTESSGTIDVRRGAVTFDSGFMLADTLLVTNGTQGQFVFNGGTLRVRNMTNDAVGGFMLGNGSSPAALDLISNGTSRFLNGIQIANNATLQGNGVIMGNVVNGNGGALSPGASIGTISIAGGLVLAGGSSSIFEVNKAAATNDFVTGLTNVTYGGTLVVTNLGGSITNGDEFKLFSAATYSGSFSAVAGPVPGPGLKWNLNRLSVDGVLRAVVSPTAPPAIGNFSLANDTNVFVGAYGGVPYDPVYLLTSTNLTTPLAGWTIVATNYFAADGSAAFTNTVAPGQPQQFFSLQVD